MYRLLKLEHYDDYFKPISQRTGRGVYFCRFIGYDDEKMIFFRRYQLEAQKKGIYIKKTIHNPTENEVQYFFKTIGEIPFSVNQEVLQSMVDRWFDPLELVKRKIYTESMGVVLQELAKQGANENILKNAFIKLMCWSKYIFEGVIEGMGADIPPKVLYEGNITKYEVHMLRLLSLIGCDILYLHFANEDSYVMIDKERNWSQCINGKKRGTPQIHFSAIDLRAWEQKKEREKTMQLVSDMLVTNTWMHGSFMEELWKENNQRGVLDQSHIYNLCIRYLGVDVREEYQNRLFQWKKELKEKKKAFVFAEGRLGNPTIDETKQYHIQGYTNRKELIDKLISKMKLSQDKMLDGIIQSAFLRAMAYNKEDALSRLYNDGMKLLCWLNRYFDSLFAHFQYDVLPVFFYYGNCNESEAEFITMLSYMPVDVLFVSPNQESAIVFHKQVNFDKALEEILPNQTEIFPFPQKEVKVRIATVAYNAQRELDTMLYSGTGLFRNRQFTRSKAVTLRTTYEEIEILWKAEAKYREGFQAEEGRVTVPNIFAKISGVKDKDTNTYFKRISQLFTEKTIFIEKFPYISFESPNSIKPYVYKFIRNGEILPDVIKKHKEYKYDFLNENIQDYILEKIQEMLELKWIHSDSMGVENIILATLLNLDKKTLHLIQQFDFTRDIPKVLVLDVDESMASIEDCIYLLFLNLIGFDIAVFTPTGFRNIDKYIDRNAFEEYQIGEYMFQLHIPPLERMKIQGIQNQSSEGFLNKLFGRGRN